MPDAPSRGGRGLAKRDPLLAFLGSLLEMKRAALLAAMLIVAVSCADTPKADMASLHDDAVSPSASSTLSATEQELEAVLLDAADAEGRYSEANDGLFTRKVEELQRHGLTVPEGIDLRIPFINDRPNFHRNYCIQATDLASGVTMQYDNLQKLRPGRCKNAWFGS
jgi:hypothetical protein